MRLHTLYARMFLAGIILGNSGTAWTDSTSSRGNSGSKAAEETTQDMAIDDYAQQSVRESFELAAVDYCYRGSTVDPRTGETVDLYTLCTDDVIKGNMDLA
jgi:hypothetical protein